MRLRQPTSQAGAWRTGGFAGSIALAAAALAAACSGGGSSAPPGTGMTGPVTVPAVTGIVTSGKQPISGSAVTLYAAAPTATATATAIGQASTDPSGNFQIDRIDPVPATGTPLYAVAVGGNAGGGANPAIRLLGMIGSYCSPASTGCAFPASIHIDERVTAASVLALAPFIRLSGDAVSIAAPTPGSLNAVATLAHLVDIFSGQPASFLDAGSCGGSSPAVNCPTLAKLDTLANIVASCSASAGPSSSACSDLLTQTSATGDTLSALLSLAVMPVPRGNAAGVFALQTPAQPYSPSLSAAPTDWTLALSYSGGGLNAPAGIAIDAGGDLWIADNGGGGALSKFGPTGTPISPETGYTGNGLNGPLGVAVDPQGHVWVANWAQGSGSQISEFSADGSAVSGSPYGSGVLGPIDLAITAAGSVWVANYGNSSLVELGPGGSVMAGPLTGHGLNFPTGIALDASGAVWVVNGSGNSVSQFDSSGNPIGTSAYSGGGLDQPYGIALDAAGDAWVPNQSGNSLTELVGGTTPPSSCPVPLTGDSTGCALSPSQGLTGGGLSGPTSVAIDGADQVWAVNRRGASITERTSSGASLTPASGYTGPGVLQPAGIAIDASGDVWVTNSGAASITEFVGLAVPVATPKIGLPRAP